MASVLFVCGWLAAGLTAGAQDALAQAPATPETVSAPRSAAPAAAVFKPEEIEALVAPIALYPDSLLSQVLMASTYPLEIVHAARWLEANPSFKGDAAVEAVASKPWDASVKSLVAFPQVLAPMNDRLDWTQKLGDAVLAQQKDVLDAVQRLRLKAQGAGNLKTTEQQKVIVEPAPAGAAQQTIVRIEPANPQVIYVPSYDPTYVYGSWGYPAYPPYYWPVYPAWYPGYYPGYYYGGAVAFGVGLVVGAAIFGNCNWGGGNININVDRAARVDHHFDRNRGQQGGGRWQHDPGHRQGVAYRDAATREKFGRGAGGADQRASFRGYDGPGHRAGAAGAGRGDRAGAGARPAPAGGVGRSGGVDRSGGGRASPTAGASGAGSFGGGAAAARPNAFQGVGGGSATQRDFSRGQSTAQRSSSSRSSAGASHGSGFSRGGGGGGRGGGGGGGGGRSGGRR